MTPSTDPKGEEISALVRELHSAMTRQRRGFPETIRFFEENIPPALMAGGTFHAALAEAAHAGSPDLESWALGRYAETVDASEPWARLRECRWRMADYAGAQQADLRLAPACLREGKRAEALAALARCFSHAPGPEASPALLALLGPVANVLADPASEADALALRRGLRKHLLFLLAGEAPPGDFNLAFIDMSSAEYAGPQGSSRALESFQELVADPKSLPQERLADSPDLRVLWRYPGHAFLADSRQAKPLSTDAVVLEAAALCSHFRFPLPPPKPSLGFGAPESESRETLIAREGHALCNLGLLGTLMGPILGVQGFAHPDAARLMEDLARAGIRYAATGRNAEPAYGQMVHFFCATNAFSNAFMAFLIRLYNPPYPSEGCRSAFGHFGGSEVEAVARNLKRDGIHIFGQKLPEAWVDELVAYARTAPCYRKDDKTKDQESAPFPTGSARGNLYDFKEADLIRVPAIQRMMADEGLYEISQAYFGAKPNLDAVQMWWSPVFDRQASSEAAQMYHFDLERVQWLKWFVYLTDVDSGAGPHCFVRGSHRAGRKPGELLARGYQRIPDQDMARFYPKEDLLEITGGKGTLFVEDTSGWHKGKVPTTSDRLVLEIELSNTLFGTLSPRDARIPPDAFPPLLAKARARPQFLGKYGLP
ncbi:MAG: hypothetical protein JF616_16400 [Fibrobacteres bacterium]|nr:hypothetical protein [Fibrobacterota bacterium]